MKGMVTALYDCRSKQEYIYRTNKVKEIAGASALLEKVYERFYKKCSGYDIKIDNSWKEKSFSKAEFEASDYDGIVVYEGGGNLYMLYKSREIYIKANRIFSKMLIDETYTISVIASAVPTSDDFNEDRKKLYEANKYQKNLGTFSAVCNALPFTQTDRNTWQPVVQKKNNKDITREAQFKIGAYDKYCQRDESIQSENLDSLVWEKGEESLLAVIYIDGNAMGSKIKTLTENVNGFDECVNKLRKFSLDTNKIYVREPLKAIEKMLSVKREKIKDRKSNLHKYRKIIGGGDEITLICNARDAKDIVLAYFDVLKKQDALVVGEINASCAGIAIFHSHDPFSEIYKIAEAACETGKKETRKSNSRDNYIDFHYCHSGIVNELETIRNEQEKDVTARPYELEKFRDFCKYGNEIREIGRQNVKALRDSIFMGDSYFEFEIRRILSRYPKGSFVKLNNEFKDSRNEFKRLVYDISLVFDLWFENESAGEENENQN